MPNTTINTRIQLKHDTEANWLAHPITPLDGELIIYTADHDHSYTRLKIGDGIRTTTELDFIDAGTIDGKSLPPELVHTYENNKLFPQPGINGALYIDLSTGIIYCYTQSSGYTKLYNYKTEKVKFSDLIYWRPGIMTSLSCSGGILTVRNGSLPDLTPSQIEIVRDITREVDE